MKQDEFAFLNQQLAAMLREGIPLEGAMRQLSGTMQRGWLRSEVEALEAELAKGTPLEQAIAPRSLPPLYKRMVCVGAKSQDLPGVLTLLADYYQEQSLIWARLRGLMTYPLLVLCGIFALSLGFHFFLQKALIPSIGAGLVGLLDGPSLPFLTQLTMPLLHHSWVFPLGFGLLLLAAVILMTAPRLRSVLAWRLPAFREAGLARIASALSLLLDHGVPLPEAIALIQDMEDHTATRTELGRWQERLSQGVSRFSEAAAGGRVFPPLFVWLSANVGSGLADGFRRAAEIYRARASARSEIMLHAALPVAVMTLGLVVVLQAVLMISMLLPLVTMMGG